VNIYQPGDKVSVRSGAPTWWPGVVSFVDDSRILVGMSQPWPTGDQWSGMSLPYSGGMSVKTVTIWKASEVVSQGQGQGCHIKPRD